MASRDVERNYSVTQVAGERTCVPKSASISVEHERDDDEEEVEFQLKWQLAEVDDQDECHGAVQMTAGVRSAMSAPVRNSLSGGGKVPRPWSDQADLLGARVDRRIPPTSHGFVVMVTARSRQGRRAAPHVGDHLRPVVRPQHGGLRCGRPESIG
ncbi:MAG TPA: hypothetical protein VGV93_04010 [Acidimicrobiales bacterium]|nr:hypothetical protein [Acidimicrobiales bacterium]